MNDRETELVGYPSEFVRRYRQAGHWRQQTLGGELKVAMSAHAHHPALITREVRWTYAELDEMCESFAAGLLAATPLRPGDAVMFSMGNVAETVVAYYGAVRAGVVPVCTLPHHRERELGLLAAHVGARGIIAQADFKDYGLDDMARRVAKNSQTIETVLIARGRGSGVGPDAQSFESLLAAGSDPGARAALSTVRIDPESVVAYQLSGGTTGLPKVAPRRHEEYAYNSRQWAATLGWAPGTKVLYPLPVMHNAGIALAIQPAHLKGASVILTPSADTGDILAAIAAERPDALPLIPPAVAVRLLDDPRSRDTDLSSIRDFIVGGQALPVEVANRLERELGIRCRQTFGMAEGMFLVTPPGASDHVRLHTVGAPISPDDEIRILDVGAETEVADGAEGEFCVRGPYTIRGYLRAPQHNAASFTAEGFYRTGDIARRQHIGGGTFYSIEGRIKDVINRGVEKVHAEEVEELILCHPDIHSAALVAMPDPVLGERVCAYLVLEAGTGAMSVTELGQHLLSQGLAKYKLPERIEVVASLPLTNVGKISKKLLREDIARKLSAEQGGRN